MNQQDKFSRQKQTLLNEFTNPALTGTGNTYILKQQDYNQIFKTQMASYVPLLENTPKYQLRKLFQNKRQQEQMQEVLEKSSLKTLKALKNSIIEFNDFVSLSFAELLAEGFGYNPEKIKDDLEKKLKVNPDKMLLPFLFQILFKDSEYHYTQFRLLFQKILLGLAKKYRPTFINHHLSDNTIMLNSTKNAIKLTISMIFLNPLMEEIESYIRMPKETLPTNFYTRLSNEILNTINENPALQLYEDTGVTRMEEQYNNEVARLEEEMAELRVRKKAYEGPKRRNAIDMGIMTGKNPFNIPKKVTFNDEISQLTKQIQKNGIFSQQDLQFGPPMPPSLVRNQDTQIEEKLSKLSI